MKTLKNILIVVSVFINLSIIAQTKSVSVSDLKQLIGNWKGTLTYLDYSSGKQYTMPADVVITQNENSKEFVLFNLYPDEPKANSKDTLIVSANGKMLNNRNIKSYTKSKDGKSEIVTEYIGNDGNDNKPATIREIYSFGENQFSIKKEIQFVGDDKWILRHTYAYQKSSR